MPSNNKSVEHTSAVACTLTIQGHIEGFSVSMLVDTGSSVTLIHVAVWNKVKNHGQKFTLPMHCSSYGRKW